MELSDLHIFRTVVNTGSITGAARVLHRVQSNITTRIRQLEADLGTELFIREQRRLRLAPSGALLLGFAERLLDLADEARQAVQSSTPQGHLRLGAMESTAATRLPPVLAAFHQRYPSVSLELRTGPTARMTAGVLDGSLDCALVAGPIDHEQLDIQPVFQEELVLVTPPGSPSILSPKDLGCPTLLTFEAGCAYRLRLESWLAEQGVPPQRVVELASYHTMLGCVAAGMGIALIPDSLLQRLPDARHVTRHSMPTHIGQVTTVFLRRRQGCKPAVGALLEALRSATPTPEAPLPQI